MPVNINFNSFDFVPQTKQIADATTTSAGVMSAADKAKLDSLTPGGGGSSNEVFWKPSGGAGYLQTWDQVMAAVAASSVPLRIVVEFGETYTIPPGTYNMNWAFISASVPYWLGRPACEITASNGVLLQDLAGIEGIQLSCYNNGAPLLSWNWASGNAVFCISGGSLLAAYGDHPPIVVPSVQYLTLVMRQFSGFAVIGLAGAAVSLESSAIIAIIVEQGWFPGTCGGGKLTAADSNCLIGFFHFGQVGEVDLTDPSIPCPILNIAETIAGGSGNTGARPSGPSGPPLVGTMFFDTSLTYPQAIWWTGSDWTDYAGNVV